MNASTESFVRRYIKLTTVNGIGRIYLSKDIAVKIFWLATCIGTMAGIGVGSVKHVQNYYRYATKVMQCKIMYAKLEFKNH